MKLHLWPGDIPAEDFGDRAEFFGVREFVVQTPHGPAPVQYLLYRIPGTMIHFELTAWSFDRCTFEQTDWMVDHEGAFRHQVLRHLECIVGGLPPGW